MNEVPTAAPQVDASTPALTPFEQALERATGRTIQDLRDTPIDVARARIEKQHGKPMTVVQGERLNVLTAQQINDLVDEALKIG